MNLVEQKLLKDIRETIVYFVALFSLLFYQTPQLFRNSICIFVRVFSFDIASDFVVVVVVRLTASICERWFQCILLNKFTFYSHNPCAQFGTHNQTKKSMHGGKKFALFLKLLIFTFHVDSIFSIEYKTFRIKVSSATNRNNCITWNTKSHMHKGAHTKKSMYRLIKFYCHCYYSTVSWMLTSRWQFELLIVLGVLLLFLFWFFFLHPVRFYLFFIHVHCLCEWVSFLFYLVQMWMWMCEHDEALKRN